ncbi:MAG: hypothetical protein Q9207_005815 [Kuettlingeria erythrocarpa]
MAPTWRTVSRISRGFAEISLAIADSVQHSGFKRPISAIDPKVIDRTAERVTQAFEGNKMLPEKWKNETAEAVVTSMEHKSDKDSVIHWILVGVDRYRNILWKGHVPKNPADKQHVRNAA